MSKQELELKKDDFTALKGKISGVDKDNNIVTVSLDLTETFENPPKDSLETKLSVEDSTRLEKIIIEIKGGEVVEGEGEDEEDRKKITMEDLKKHQEVLVSLMNPAMLYKLLDLEKVEAEEILVFGKK